MFFLWLPSSDLAVQRVVERMRAGGHAVPEEVVRRRFRRGIKNFFEVYEPILDGCLILDNSASEPLMISLLVNGYRFIFEQDLWEQVREGL
jgi:predicted ABC-type ATPase